MKKYNVIDKLYDLLDEYSKEEKIPKDAVRSLIEELENKELVEKNNKTNWRIDQMEKYAQFDCDINRAVAKLSEQKSYENFGDKEIRAIKDKWSNYLHGNWQIVKPFVERLKSFESWCNNYTNYE